MLRPKSLLLVVLTSILPCGWLRLLGWCVIGGQRAHFRCFLLLHKLEPQSSLVGNFSYAHGWGACHHIFGWKQDGNKTNQFLGTGATIKTITRNSTPTSKTMPGGRKRKTISFPSNLCKILACPKERQDLLKAALKCNSLHNPPKPDEIGLFWIAITFYLG